ncbi:MAG TPA: NAD(P)H nitroreductase [Eubacteriaceae bacterium]|nr:NAD(P)H nitroreductase [Eubacteriaceae bacterium]
MDQWFEWLKSRRSIRKFKQKKVDEQVIKHMLQSASIVPSSKGRKPWEFVVVQDETVLSELSRCKEHGSAFLKNAAAAIAVVADPKKCDVWIEDASIAAYTLQLSAHQEGLGSCWVQVRERMHDKKTPAQAIVKSVLSIPDGYEVLCIIGFGYPDEEKKEYELKDVMEEKFHYEKY